MSTNTNTITTETPKPIKPKIPSPAELRAQLSHQGPGYIHIPSFYTTAQVSELRIAAHKISDLAKEGKWPFVRTLDRQFPPWPVIGGGHGIGIDIKEVEGIWGVQHLMHPDLDDEIRDVFLRSYFDFFRDGRGLMSVVQGILAGDDDEFDNCKENDENPKRTAAGNDVEEPEPELDLVMELYNLLIQPTNQKPFQLIWHRDGIPKSASKTLESQILSKPIHHTQWNLALYEDSSLIIIPESHSRLLTEVERDALENDPYKAELPGMKVVEMGVGDVVFYDNNLLHRGVYDGKRDRLTLHGSVSCVPKLKKNRKGNGNGNAVGDGKGAADDGGVGGRARNVLQHGVGEWIDRMDLGGLKGETRRRAEEMRGRLLELGRANPEVKHIHDL